MNIEVKKEENVCTLMIEGRIDTVTAPELEKMIRENADDCNKMILDMSGVDYISSAGLRVFLVAHRLMEKKNGFVLKGLTKNVLTILQMTGFDSTLHIKE